MGAERVIDIGGHGVQRQFKAAGAITPGHLIEIDANGEVVVHATAAGNALKLFAIENELEGEEKTVAYSDNDTVQSKLFPPGSEVNAIANAAVAVGAFVESAGNGKLRTVAASAATSEAQRASVVGVAIEAAAADGDYFRILTV